MYNSYYILYDGIEDLADRSVNWRCEITGSNRSGDSKNTKHLLPSAHLSYIPTWYECTVIAFNSRSCKSLVLVRLVCARWNKGVCAGEVGAGEGWNCGRLRVYVTRRTCVCVLCRYYVCTRKWALVYVYYTYYTCVAGLYLSPVTVFHHATTFAAGPSVRRPRPRTTAAPLAPRPYTRTKYRRRPTRVVCCDVKIYLVDSYDTRALSWPKNTTHTPCRCFFIFCFVYFLFTYKRVNN